MKPQPPVTSLENMFFFKFSFFIYDHPYFTVMTGKDILKVIQILVVVLMSYLELL